LQAGQLSAAIREMGVLSGQRVERKEIGPPGAFDGLTDDELERALVDALEELGLSKTQH